MGEIFVCKFQLEDGSTTEYFSEQVSHHPPISAVHVFNEKNKIEIRATVSPTAALHIFSNSATISMKGAYHLKIGKDEIYEIIPPTILIKNIFWGKIKMGYTGKSSIICKKTGYRSEIEWNIDEIDVKIFDKGREISRIFGNLHKELELESHFNTIETFLDITKQKPLKKEVISIPKFENEESRK